MKDIYHCAFLHNLMYFPGNDTYNEAYLSLLQAKNKNPAQNPVLRESLSIRRSKP